jgi:hypothetical protein
MYDFLGHVPANLTTMGQTPRPGRDSRDLVGLESHVRSCCSTVRLPQSFFDQVGREESQHLERS